MSYHFTDPRIKTSLEITSQIFVFPLGLSGQEVKRNRCASFFLPNGAIIPHPPGSDGAKRGARLRMSGVRSSGSLSLTSLPRIRWYRRRTHL